MKNTILGLILVELLLGVTSRSSLASSQDWDVLIFTQRWPNTACSQWHQKSKDNKCSLPNQPGIWTIHGIWPTKYGTRGPSNCNNSWVFNDTAIEPLENQLEQYWINVEENTKLDSLWKHEWSKHGTCAAVLPQLDSEYKYFGQGLEWIQQYNMKDILNQKQIQPSTWGYVVQHIYDAVKNVLGKNPIIECVIDKKTKESLISEIRICFDKQLNLTDCDLVKSNSIWPNKHYKVAGGLHTNCNLKKLVIYLDDAELVARDSIYESPKLPFDIDFMQETVLEGLLKTRQLLITIYTTVKLVMWATL